MATKKIATYTTFEIAYLTQKFEEFKTALDSYDLTNLADRYGPRMMPNGKIVDALIESKSDQMKAVMYILEKLPKLVASIEELKAIEAKKDMRKGFESEGNILQDDES